MPAAAFGVTAELAERITERTEADYEDTGGIGGTLAGNALSLAAVRATLEHVLTEDAFARTIPLAERFTADVSETIEDAALPWHVTQLGCRAEYRFRPTPPRTGAEAADAIDAELDRVHARPRAQPRRAPDAVPQHGAHVTGDDACRRRSPQRGLRPGRGGPSWLGTRDRDALLIGGEQVAGDGRARSRSRTRTRRRRSPRSRSRPRSRSTRRSPPRARRPATGRRRRRSSAASSSTRWPRGYALAPTSSRELMTLEGGKPLVENSDEVGWTAAAFDYYAEMGRNFAGRVIPSIESTQLALVLKEPMGVVGCIVPWNYPLLLLAWKLAPALAAGNTVVCKPSELTPLSTLALADCFDQLPAGRRQPPRRRRRGRRGDRPRRTRRLRRVHRLGRHRASGSQSICAERVARVNLELGGKDPFIVCEDVAEPGRGRREGRRLGGLPQRRPGLHVGGALLRPRAGVRRLRLGLRRLHGVAALGDPLDPETDIGPLVSRAPARQGGGPGRRRRRGRRHAPYRRQRRGHGHGPLLRAGGRHRRSGARPTCCARRPSARSRRSSRSRASTRRSSSPTRRASGSAATSTRRTSTRSCAACARSRPARSGSTTR